MFSNTFSYWRLVTGYLYLAAGFLLLVAGSVGGHKARPYEIDKPACRGWVYPRPQ